MNSYSMVSMATEIYQIINNNMPEHDVPMNLAIIPNLCDCMENSKIARNGVYLGISSEISLMVVDEKEHQNADFDLKFYEVVKQKNGIPFVEKHVKLLEHKSSSEVDYLKDIYDVCMMGGFVID